MIFGKTSGAEAKRPTTQQAGETCGDHLKNDDRLGEKEYTST